MNDFDLSKITGNEPPLVTDDDKDAEIAALRERLAELESDDKRMTWLIQNGERIFGSLWREASKRDIDAEMQAPDSAASQPRPLTAAERSALDRAFARSITVLDPGIDTTGDQPGAAHE